MDIKILQILPAPNGLYAHYSGSADNDEAFYEQAVCMALVEVGNGSKEKFREVRAMVCAEKDDFIAFPDEAENFLGLCYIHENTATKMPGK